MFATDIERLEQLVTGRDVPLFDIDIERARSAITAVIEGRRVLVVGGGGSIGSITTKILFEFKPAAVHVVDQSENYLAELVREIRSQPRRVRGVDFRTFPLDYGSPIMQRLLADMEHYDFVLNFAAIKHVRSEKDVYSLLQMIDTNLVKHARLKRWLKAFGHADAYFAVSTDKAANPTSLMGASKRLMEDLIFDVDPIEGQRVTSARFANVAFSNGSLLQSWVQRLIHRQPLAAPRATRRYFMSHREAGQLCILAAFQAPHAHVLFPRLDPQSELKLLEGVAGSVIEAYGLKPEYFDEESHACLSLDRLAVEGRWPIVLTPLDTSGEKPYEEFVGYGECEVEIGLKAIGAIRHRRSRAVEKDRFTQLSRLCETFPTEVTKEEIVELVRSAITTFHHVETGRNLDQRF
jgi:FlaA1/EpsC-like NDP-sugar epimerase